MRDDLGRAIRVWNAGLLSNGAAEYQDAWRHLQKAAEEYRTALKSKDAYPAHNPYAEVDEEILRAMDDPAVKDEAATIEAKGGDSQTPLWWAVKDGHEAMVKLLLDGGAALKWRLTAKRH